MAGTTTNYGWPYQQAADPPDGASLGEDLAVAADADLAALDADVVAIDARLDLVEGRTLSRGNRTTTKATAGASAEIGYLRIDNLACKAGHLYRVTASNLRFVETIASGSNFKFNLRINAVASPGAGVAATTSSTPIIGRSEGAVSAQSLAPAIGYRASAVNETVSVLLSFFRTSGGTGVGTIQGTDDQGIHLVWEDLGTDPGDTGVDA